MCSFIKKCGRRDVRPQWQVEARADAVPDAFAQTLQRDPARDGRNIGKGTVSRTQGSGTELPYRTHCLFYSA